ncbi:hypothetical protein K8I85_04130 [bacterium]|nr:hypothetical protein [bacterium]
MRQLTAAALTALILVSVAALLPPAASAEAPAPALFGIRPLGMGNTFVAVADDRNTLYYNPAGLAHLESTRLSGIGVHAGIDNRFFDVIGFVQDNQDAFSDFENVDQEFYDSLAPYDERWVAADARAYSDLTRPYLGFGVYSTGRAQFKIDRGIYEPRVYADVRDDIVAVVGGAMELGRMDLRVGGALKGIWRRETSRALTALEVSDFDPNDIMNDLASAEPGFSMDLGVTWQRPGSPWTAGAALRDATGYISGEGVDTSFDVGGAWRPLPDGIGPVRGVLLAADLRNAFEGTALGNKLHLGAEVSIPFLSVRAGVGQGYPSLGATAHIPFFSLDYALYGRELGGFPGAEGQYMHAVEARIGY